MFEVPQQHSPTFRKSRRQIGHYKKKSKENMFCNRFGQDPFQTTPTLSSTFWTAGPHFNHVALTVSIVFQIFPCHGNHVVKHQKPKAKYSFNSLKPTKICEFLHDCQLIFQNDKCAFSIDHQTLPYAVTYLTGTAQYWLEYFLQHLAIHEPPIYPQQLQIVQRRPLCHL